MTIEDKKNSSQDMYICNTYEIMYGPIYGGVTIDAWFGNKKIVIRFPDGDKFFKELEKQRKETLK